MTLSSAEASSTLLVLIVHGPSGLKTKAIKTIEADPAGLKTKTIKTNENNRSGSITLSLCGGECLDQGRILPTAH